MVLFTFKPEAAPDRIAALLDEYARFPDIHRGMRNFSIGRNISERDQSYEWAFSVDFANEEALKAYLNSPEHEQHVVERFRPIIEKRAIASYRA